MKRRKKKEIGNAVDSESIELDIEELTEVQGGIEAQENQEPEDTCGLGCYLGSGDEPTD